MRPLVLAWHERVLSHLDEAGYRIRVPFIGRPPVGLEATLGRRLRAQWSTTSPSPGWAVDDVSVSVESKAPGAGILVLSVAASESSTVGWRLDGAGMGRSLDDAVASS